MKTSYILLAIVAVVALTGMVATDVLLKREYDKIDWRNPYQNFERRALPTARHWVIDGTPVHEIVVVRSTDTPQALIGPGAVKFYRTRQQGDTVFVAFTPDYDGYQGDPRNDADHELGVRLVLQMLPFQTMRVVNARLTLSELTTDTLRIMLENSRLRTKKINITGSFGLTAAQNSFVVLGADQYKNLYADVRDSSGIRLNDTQTAVFTPAVSPRAEVQLRGRALRWLTNNENR